MLTRFVFPVLLSAAGLLFFLLPLATTNNIEAEESPIENYTGSNTLTYQSDQALCDQHATLKAEVTHRDNLFYLNLWIDGYENRITFVVRNEVIKETAFELDHPSQRYLSFLYHGKECTYSSDDYYTGMLMIHRYDTAQKIIAGSFEFIAYSNDCDELVRINNGMFDATYVSN